MVYNGTVNILHMTSLQCTIINLHLFDFSLKVFLYLNKTLRPTHQEKKYINFRFGAVCPSQQRHSNEDDLLDVRCDFNNVRFVYLFNNSSIITFIKDITKEYKI